MQFNGKIVAIVVAAVVVVAGVGVGVFVMNKSSSDDYTYESKAYFGVFGNANGDTSIDSKDVDFIKDLMNQESIDMTKNKLADANNDGKIDQDDVDFVNSMIDGTATKVYYVNVDGNTCVFNIKSSYGLVPLHRTVTRSILILSSQDPNLNIVGSDKTILEPEFAQETKLPDIVNVGTSTAPDHEEISNIEKAVGSTVVFAGRAATYDSTLETSFQNSENVQIVRMNTWEGDALGGILTVGYLLGGVGYKSPEDGGSGKTAWDQAKAYENWYMETLTVITKYTKDLADEDRKTVLATYLGTDVGGKPFTEVYSSTAGNTLRGKGSGDMENTILCGGNNITNKFSGSADANGRQPWTMEEMAQHAKNVDVFIVLCKGMFYSANEFQKGETQLREAFEGYLSPNTSMYMVSWEMNGAPEPVQLAYFAKILCPNSSEIQSLNMSDIWDGYLKLIGYDDMDSMKYSNLSFECGPIHTTTAV